MVSKILCVAEKPAIAKSVANHLSGGQINTVRHPACITNVAYKHIEKHNWKSICEKL